MQNCWQLKSCGREPGGAKADELGVCPAALDEACDGTNEGTNAGRLCWAIAGTLCGSEVQGSFAKKHLECLQCGFFQTVKRETGASFRLLPPKYGKKEAVAAAEAAYGALVDQFQALTSVLDEVDAVIYVADFETYELLYTNRHTTELFGYGVGKRCYEVLQTGQTGPCSFCTNGQLVVDGKAADPVVWEFQNTVNHQWFLCIDRAIRWVDGRLVRMEVAVDITERKRAEEIANLMAAASNVLAGSLDYHATLAAVVKLVVPRFADACAIHLLDDDGRLEPIEVPASDQGHADLVRAWRASTEPDHASLARDVLASGKSQLLTDIGDASTPDLAATERVRSVIAVPLIAQGRAFGVMTLVASAARRDFDAADLSLAENVGTRAALALANARLYESAQQAIHAREEILGIVAHDLRNPLNNILMAADIIGEGSSIDQAHSMAGSVKRTVKRMAQLIDDLLSSTVIESGRFTVARATHDVRALVAEAVETMGPLAQQKGLTLETQIGDGLPPVECDPDRMLEVFSNLIGNAIKFTPAPGHVRVAARTEGAGVLFSVEDTGPGMGPDVLPHVFDRYWQGRHARRAGAGLGLHIVKGIVEAHGGTVWAESRVGEGSTFFFTLPLVKPSAGSRSA
jgi:signal transduction histidine kinase